MTEYVTVKISGTFPAEDVDMLASFYGLSSNGMIQQAELTQEEKLENLIKIAQSRLAEFLAAPTKNAINKQAQEELRGTLAAVDARVKASLQSEIITTEA